MSMSWQMLEAYMELDRRQDIHGFLLSFLPYFLPLQELTPPQSLFHSLSVASCFEPDSILIPNLSLSQIQISWFDPRFLLLIAISLFSVLFCSFFFFSFFLFFFSFFLFSFFSFILECDVSQLETIKQRLPEGFCLKKLTSCHCFFNQRPYNCGLSKYGPKCPKSCPLEENKHCRIGRMKFIVGGLTKCLSPDRFQSLWHQIGVRRYQSY